MATYQINIERHSDTEGSLTLLVDGKPTVESKCWWDPQKRIEAKTYTACSTTRMDSKEHKSVFLPDEQTGMTGIFIHPGTRSEDSDGCIVVPPAKMDAIFAAVSTPNQKNVMVVVSDGAPPPAKPKPAPESKPQPEKPKVEPPKDNYERDLRNDIRDNRIDRIIERHENIGERIHEHDDRVRDVIERNLGGEREA